MPDVAVLGTVGVPANYGGFETLAENLVRYHGEQEHPGRLTVYCSAKAYPKQPEIYDKAQLRYLPLSANGVQSIPYDGLSLIDCCMRRTRVVLLLGVSGALLLPLVRLISRARIITNIDGIEWRREKWKGLAKTFLRLSEKAAVKWSHEVVADNEAIAEYVHDTYGRDCHVIAYGGDHAVATEAAEESGLELPDRYALALCRIEPENNVAMILEAFARMENQPLVFVGNWSNSEYGRQLREQYAGYPNLFLCDPVYDAARLRAVRDRAWLYVHGHSAGGTNPSLVEMMHFGIPVVAHDCDFNRYTTESSARYFQNAGELQDQVLTLTENSIQRVGERMVEIARRRYTWEAVGSAYFSLINR